MAQRHLLLTNDSISNDGWKKTRNVPSSDDDREEVRPDERHQLRLVSAAARFVRARDQRHERKNVDDLANIDLVQISFFKDFDKRYEAQLNERYGFAVVKKFDFNRTALFQNTDLDRLEVFISHVNQFAGAMNHMLDKNIT